MNQDVPTRNTPALVAEVDELGEQVKTLAINLAIYLAKAKSESTAFNRFEPEFIKLINGTLKVVQELAGVINASKSEKPLVYDVPGNTQLRDQLEVKMMLIAEQCQRVLAGLSEGPTGKADPDRVE